ncbi:MAG: S1 RNA-binding domain-containing protein [Minisyncoccales bacterium]
MTSIFYEKEEKIPRSDEVVEGEIIKKDRAFIFLNLGPLGVAVIWPADVLKNKNKLKKIKIGDKLLVRIVAPENEEGFIEVKPIENFLSKKPTKFSAKVVRVLKDGVVFQSSLNKEKEFFLPLEDLPSEVKESLEKKEELLNKEFKMNGEFLEKIPSLSVKNKEEQIKEGEILDGTISGLTSFGAFVKIRDEEGLIPFSTSENLSLKIGKRIKVKVTKISGDKIFLSLVP